MKKVNEIEVVEVEVVLTNKELLQNAISNLSKEDLVPDNEFSEVIWKGVKGLHAIMPAPRRAAFIKVIEDEDEKK